LGDDGNLFLVAASGPKMGKTSTLLTWALSVAEEYSPHETRFLIFDFHKRSMGSVERLPHTLTYIGRRNGLEAGLRELANQVQQRREYTRGDKSLTQGDSPPALIVFVDDYFTFLDECSEDEKRQLWDDFSDPLVKKVRTQGSGILISPKEGSDLYRYAKIPPMPVPIVFGPGRGWLIRRGQAQLIQVALCNAPDEDGKTVALHWVERICSKYSALTNHN
jgi:hypothetical protein